MGYLPQTVRTHETLVRSSPRCTGGKKKKKKEEEVGFHIMIDHLYNTILRFTAGLR